MTSNQIAYWSLQEQKRANLVNEDLKRDDVQSQIQRRRSQNQTDARQAASAEVNASANVAKAITGGVKDLASLLFV